VRLLQLTAAYDKVGFYLHFYVFYVDDLIVELRQSGLELLHTHWSTADDIALIACSCLGLQKLINMCMAFGLQWDIRLNLVKSQMLVLVVNPLSAIAPISEVNL